VFFCVWPNGDRGPQLILNRVGGALEGTVLVCAKTYGRQTTVEICMQLCA
jgi:hypothetical protein